MPQQYQYGQFDVGPLIQHGIAQGAEMYNANQHLRLAQQGQDFEQQQYLLNKQREVERYIQGHEADSQGWAALRAALADQGASGYQVQGPNPGGPAAPQDPTSAIASGAGGMGPGIDEGTGQPQAPVAMGGMGPPSPSQPDNFNGLPQQPTPQPSGAGPAPVVISAPVGTGGAAGPQAGGGMGASVEAGMMPPARGAAPQPGSAGPMQLVGHQAGPTLSFAERLMSRIDPKTFARMSPSTQSVIEHAMIEQGGFGEKLRREKQTFDELAGANVSQMYQGDNPIAKDPEARQASRNELVDRWRMMVKLGLMTNAQIFKYGNPATVQQYQAEILRERDQHLDYLAMSYNTDGSTTYHPEIKVALAGAAPEVVQHYFDEKLKSDQAMKTKVQLLHAAQQAITDRANIAEQGRNLRFDAGLNETALHHRAGEAATQQGVDLKGQSLGEAITHNRNTEAIAADRNAVARDKPAGAIAGARMRIEQAKAHKASLEKQYRGVNEASGGYGMAPPSDAEIDRAAQPQDPDGLGNKLGDHEYALLKAKVAVWRKYAEASRAVDKAYDEGSKAAAQGGAQKPPARDKFDELIDQMIDADTGGD